MPGEYHYWNCRVCKLGHGEWVREGVDPGTRFCTEHKPAVPMSYAGSGWEGKIEMQRIEEEGKRDQAR